MFFHHVVCALILVTAVPEVSAAPQNATLVAGSSDNITFNGGGWQGPGGWQGLDPENESCTASPGRYSWTAGISVSVVFQGVAVYFVGWNNSRNGVYQPYLDGVPDSPVTAYIPAPSGPWVCNVVQYKRTGLANMRHNLTMALLTDDPGHIDTPGMGISGVIVTTEDSQLPLSITTVIPVATLTSSATNADGIITPTTNNSQSLSSTTVTEDTGPFSTGSTTVSKPIGTFSTSNTSSFPTTGTISVSPTTTGVPAVTRTAVTNASGSTQIRVLSPTLSSMLSTLTSQGGAVPATASDRSSSSTTTEVRSVSLPDKFPVLSTLGDQRPVLPTPNNGSPVSTITPGPTAHLLDSGKSSSHRVAVVGSVIGGILGMASIIAFISFAKWAHQVSHAKKASKPGAFKSKSHEFDFVIPPYVPGRPRRESAKSYQITLTLTPVDIEEGHTYQQVAWQRFNITQSDTSSTVTARLDYDRAFGTANIRTGGDAINGVAFCDHPKSFEHAKPGRPVPFKGHAWSNPLQFITRKYKRIIARNDDDVPLRVVIGSYVCEGSQPELNRSSEYVEDRDVEQGGEEDRLWGPMSSGQVGFQSFVVMDENIGYAEQISASFDLILRIYKTQDVEVGQILSPAYVRNKTVPLLGEQGIRLSKLPRVATWLVVTEGSDIRLKMEEPGLGQYLYQYL
ncbi:hypothetical protein B0H14DRAFT_2909130 [Mycena olivaceomarginata]|nr:hypothetical protein B0H14DRAFT_2909130 [Mycena olivaceomarginata]